MTALFYFDGCSDETQDEETDACRGCAAFSLYDPPECGAVWRSGTTGEVVSHLEVARLLDPELAAAYEKRRAR